MKISPRKSLSITSATTLILLISLLIFPIHAIKKATIDTKKYASVCVQNGKGYRRIQDNDSRGHAILRLVIEVSTASSIIAPDSPQHKALCYMLYDDGKKVDPRVMKGRFLDRYALVVFYMNTKGPGWLRSDNWLTKEDECSWFGITCTAPYIGRKRITGIDITFNKITGIIPRELAYISELEFLDLNGNSLQGVIPYLMLSSLQKLTKLHLHMNDLFGNIPKEIGELKNLKELTLFGNFFFGKLPSEISNLKKLEILDLYANNLSGTPPADIGKMKNLKEFYFNDNEFVGTVPKEICSLKLKNLQADCLGYNPEIKCDCCTVCCKGLPDPKCKDMRPAAQKKAAQKKK